MVVNNNDTFAALSDPTRREIISRLVDGPASVSQLVEPFNISQQAVSKHIAVLRNAGIVRQEREGRTNWCRLEPKPLEEALAWLEGYRSLWEGRLDRLEKHLQVKGAKAKKTGARARGKRRSNG